ncbi:MAG: hypothetical protein LC104_20465 [Bacteroidales bacterium]|nr:hypothetical protein [Bacteroidales bacterium]
MIESDWLKVKDPDAMLRLIGERLSPRRWQLLACAVVRRAVETVPVSHPFWPAVEWAELQAGNVANHPQTAATLATIAEATPAAIQAARDAQRLIVVSADPDADPNAFRETSDRKTNPSAPLFRAASLHAGTAIQLAGEAAEQGIAAMTCLLHDTPGADHLQRVRQIVIEATRLRSHASLYATTALDLKVRGDHAADRNTGRNVNIQLAAAQDTVTRTEEHLGYRGNDLQEAKEKADRKAMGRFLLEIVGNPMTPYRFEPHWRTDTVMGLAHAIYAERAFDRLPILADALLDADCDEEAVLRHCRGTEVHAPDGPCHIRGCWVIDQILEQEPALFQAKTIKPPKPPARRSRSTRPAPPTGFLRLLEAMNRPGQPPNEDE